jgi:hypothetical protein
VVRLVRRDIALGARSRERGPARPARPAAPRTSRR